MPEVLRINLLNNADAHAPSLLVRCYITCYTLRVRDRHVGACFRDAGHITRWSIMKISVPVVLRVDLTKVQLSCSLLVFVLSNLMHYTL